MQCKCITKTKEVKKMVSNKINVCIRLKPQTIEKIKELADKKDIRYTELVRKIVENYVRMN